MSVPAANELRRPGLTLALLAFAQLIISIDYNIVYVALPRIAAGLGFESHTLQWVVSAYAVAFGGFLLFGGRTADVLGRRRTFVIGLTIYAVTSLIGGFATDPVVLLAARAGQGIGGAFLFPATLALVVTTFPTERERYRALSIWAAAGAGGMIVGSLLGGVLTEIFGWESVFFVNVPLAGGAALAAFALLPPDVARETGRPVDLLGALTATFGVTLVVFSLVQGPAAGWADTGVLTTGVLGMLLVIAFILVERRVRDPLMPLRLFRNRDLTLGVLTTFLFMATFGTLLYFMTVYFQDVRGYTAMQTGLAFLPAMACGFAGSMLGGGIATRFGVRRTLIGSYVVGIIGAVLLGLVMTANADYWTVAAAMMVVNVAQGVVFTTMFGAATSGIAPAEQGIASGIVSTGQQIGSAVGLAVFVAVATAVTSGAAGDANAAAVTGLRGAVLAAAGGMALLVVVALGFSRPARPVTDTTGKGADDVRESVSDSAGR